MYANPPANGNFFQGSSVFSSLQNLFPQTQVSQASQTQPPKTLVSTVSGVLQKTIFGIPVWALILVGIGIAIAIFLVMK